MKFKSSAAVLLLLTASISFASSATAAGTLPSAPKNVVVSEITDYGATITWSEPTDLGGTDLSNYVIAVSQDSGATWVSQSYSGGGRFSAIESVQTATLLKADTPAQVKVAAVNEAGQGDFSEIAEFRTLVKQPPAFVFMLSVASKFGKNGGLVLSWPQPPYKVGSFKVYYRPAGKKIGSWGTGKWTLLRKLDSKTHKFETPRLAKGKNWEVDVRAVSSLGTISGWSMVVDIDKNGKMQMFH